jgi:hypothetical protein
MDVTVEKMRWAEGDKRLAYIYGNPGERYVFWYQGIQS